MPRFPVQTCELCSCGANHRVYVRVVAGNGVELWSAVHGRDKVVLRFSTNGARELAVQLIEKASLLDDSEL